VGEIIRLTYDLPVEDFSRAGEASSSLKRVMKKLGLPPEIVRRVSIAMYEGEINIFIHAAKGRIEVSITPKMVDITMSDEGPGIEDVDKAMEMGYSTASEKVRDLGFGAGMGLPNMKKNADDMIIKSKPGEGTVIKMSINI
jgi:anti-sigma regulatory factor (Ser/Thr protein kinase)